MPRRARARRCRSRCSDARLRDAEDAFTLAGIPSRARISPDGRWGGVTAFVVGHAYASPGEFSTATTIIDLRSGKAVADLEKDFTVTDDGKVVEARDRNFWGLTFADDGDTFYATLADRRRHVADQGLDQARAGRETIHENVECPSLSPDGTRIGYKKAVALEPDDLALPRAGPGDRAGDARSPRRARSTTSSSGSTTQHLLYGAEDQYVGGRRRRLRSSR